MFKKAVITTVEKNRNDGSKIGDGFENIESLDGKYRYKIGIIDLLTKFSGLKSVENMVKSTIHQVDSEAISAIDQDRY